MSEQDVPSDITSASDLPNRSVALPAAIDPDAESTGTSPSVVNQTLGWLSNMLPWATKNTLSKEVVLSPVAPSEHLVAPSEPLAEVVIEESVAIPVEIPTQSAFDWFSGLFGATDEKTVTPPPEESDLNVTVTNPETGQSISDPCGSATLVPNSVSEIFQTGVSQLGVAGTTAIDAVRSGVVTALISGIRMVSAERDRDEIIRWFVNAREILAEDSSSADTAKKLYQSVDTLGFAKLLANTVGTSISNYQGGNLPLSLKVALRVTAVGAAFIGMKYAGILALGSGIGLPVILLLFLGTAGATAIVEAFIKDRNIRDPLTKLLLTFVAFETTRRAKKDLLDAMRADAMVPERAQVPEESEALLNFLMQMDPIVFERHVMSFFEKDGYPTGLTARSNDFGVDGYVFHPDGVIVVQCKRYSAENAVGRPAIQQFKGVIEEQRAYRGYFVTTSRFTTEATESATKSGRILLVDGEELLRWHKNGEKLK